MLSTYVVIINSIFLIPTYFILEKAVSVISWLKKLLQPQLSLPKWTCPSVYICK